MSVKFSTLILKVDLSCCQCNRKIKKLLCKIQDRENIRLIAYDDKNNTVTISGPFDPQYLKRKLYCKACKIIKDIQIPPPPPEKKPDPPPEKKPDPPPEKKPNPPPEKKPDPPPEKKPDPPPEKKPDPPPEKKPDPPPEKKPDPPPEKKPDPPPEKKPDPPPEKKPDPPPEKKPEKKPDPPKSVWPPGPVCCNQPCYVGMFGGLKCASCGMVYTWTNQGPPPVMVYNQPPVPRPSYYDGYSYGYGYGHGCGCGCGQPKTCQFICEDNTSQCTIM